MPFTMNGIGTSVCCSRGDIGWGSSDAMECLVVFFMPIVPFKAVHTFDWNGQQYRQIPIRWSWELTLRTYVKPWSWGLIGIGGIFLLISAFEWNKPRAPFLLLLAIGLSLVGLGILGHVLNYLTDRRNKNVRRMIAGLTIGTCDPATLTGDLLEQMTGNPRTMYGTATFADAVEKQLSKGSFAQAMWAARMTVAVEDAREGERLTDLVLADSQVVEAIEEVARDPKSWGKIMLSDDERANPADGIDEVERIPEVEGAEPRAQRRRPRQDDEDY